jgi:hypothetical protein
MPPSRALATLLGAALIGSCTGTVDGPAQTTTAPTTTTTVAGPRPADTTTTTTTAVETVAAVSGRLLLDGAEVAFVLSAEGDWRVDVLDDSEAHAFDARARVLHQADASGRTEHVGLAPSGPDSPHGILDRFLPLTLVSRGAEHVAAGTAREGRWAGGAGIDFTDHFRRPGLEAGAFGDGLTDHIWASLDRATLLPVSVTHVADQRPVEVTVRRWEVLALDVGDVERSVFRLWEPGETKTALDHGFSRTTRDRAPAVVGYAVPAPSSLPPGFREGDVVAAAAPLLWWSYASNPPSERVVVATYRRGMVETVTVTTRAADTGHWQNPYHRGDMDLTGRPHTHPSGARFSVVDGPWPFWPVTHAWGIVGDLVITVGGDVSVDDLLWVVDALVIDQP